MTDLHTLLSRAREISEKASPARWAHGRDGSLYKQLRELKDVESGERRMLIPSADTDQVDAQAIVIWRSLILPLLDVAEAAKDIDDEFRRYNSADYSKILTALHNSLARLASVELP